MNRGRKCECSLFSRQEFGFTDAVAGTGRLLVAATYDIDSG